MAVRWREHVRIGPAVLTSVLTAALAAGCTTSSMPGDEEPSSPSHGHATAGKGREGTARKELAKLKIATAGSMAGYARDRYGTAWNDVDHNGCDTRNDILARDLERVRKRNDCVVIAGDLHDPYTGKDIDFVKAKAFDVQIDHVFPLGLAWQMGAAHWSVDKRTRLANDRDNLLAVWSRPNEQKGDKGPAEWQPRKDFQCTYAEKFIGVADEYGLTVTDADRSELKDMLDRC